MRVEINVLCVDDEPNVLRSYKRTLRNEPYGVLIAASGKEALALLESKPVQLVITDYRMAGMSGLELVREIRRRDQNIVCAILSGYADESVVNEALKQGQISRFLLKPIENDELKSEVRALLALSSASKALVGG